MPTWGRCSTTEPSWAFCIMKITEMNREQLRDYMKASREIQRYDSDLPSWKHAFKLAKLAGLENMDMQCTGCIKKVKEWLER